MIEGSFNCTVEDVDSVQQGNGAFAAVPQGALGPATAALSAAGREIVITLSATAGKSPVIRQSGVLCCSVARRSSASHYRLSLHEPGKFQNLIWKRDLLAPGWTLTGADFVARAPIRLKFDW